MGVCNCSMFCCTLLYVHSSIAIILMGKRELIALLNLSSWCLVMVERLFLAVPWGGLQFVIVVFPDHTHLLFLPSNDTKVTFAPLCTSNVQVFIGSEFLSTESKQYGGLYPRGGGGGGTLIFSVYVGSDPASTVHPQKISGISSTPKKYLKF